ncbi:MAG TPA: RodZ domain-containing protein [Allosphingosinicella sp.]|nr:RodZ domain-containing protein [Allosphingosinicella sp.]
MAEQAYSDQFQSRTIGERLHEAREAKGLSLEDVASQTRIPVRHLQHIEREEWDALPAITYCVGFVRSYANIVGLDGAELGRELRERLGGTRTRAPAPEYYQPADPARVPPRSLALIAAALAALLIIGYALWRSSLDDGDETPANVAAPAAQAPPAAAPRQAPPAQPQSLAGQPVTLVATEEVWLRISDAAGGGALFEGTLAAGQRFAVPPTAQRPVIRTARPQVLRAMVGARDLGPLEPFERTVSDLSLRADDLAARLQAGAAPTPR